MILGFSLGVSSGIFCEEN